MDAEQRWEILRLHVEDEIPLSVLAADTGVSLRSLQRWKTNFARDGLQGLQRRQRSDAGTRKIDDDLVDLVEG